MRRHTSGFETDNFTTTEWNAVSSNAPTIQTATVHSGAFAAQCATSSQVCFFTRTLQSNVTGGSLFTRMYLRFSTLPGDGENPVILNTLSSGSVASLRVVLLGTGDTLRLSNVITGTNADFSSALSTGTWYRIETRHLIADSGGEMEARLYVADSATPTETRSISGEDTLAVNVASFNFGVSVSNSTSTVYFDDVIINDDSGPVFNTWVGPSKLYMVEPASDDTVAWTRTGANCSATTNADCVDDAPGTPDDTSGYNSASTTGAADRFNKTALGAEIPSDADMISITVYARFGASGSTGTRLCRVDLWDENGAQTSGPDTGIGCDGSSGTFSVLGTSGHLTFDLGARSKADVDDADFDIGYTNRSNHDNRVTALWANVEWMEAAAPPPGPATLPRVIRW